MQDHPTPPREIDGGSTAYPSADPIQFPNRHKHSFISRPAIPHPSRSPGVALPGWLLALLEVVAAILRGAPRRPASPGFRPTNIEAIPMQIEAIFPAPQSAGNLFELTHSVDGGPPVVTPAAAVPVPFAANPGETIAGTIVEVDAAGGRSPASDPATFVVPQPAPPPDVPPLKPAFPGFRVVA